MSADLQLRQQELIEIRCPTMTIKINLSTPSSSGVTADRGSISIIRSPAAPTRIGAGNGVDSRSSDEGCRTPRSPRNMIPKTLSCPPAPRKPTKAAALSCKRKLSDFFETAAREEVESFFSQFEEKPNVNSIKRRCLV